MITRVSACVGLCFAVCASASAWADTVTIGSNFTGSNLSQSGFIPPDTMGAVGATQAVELLNGRYVVYNKSTGAVQTSSNLNTFWTNAGVTPSGGFAFDPRVVYDAGSGRWFAAAADNAGGVNSFLVAVSNTSDPLSGWKAFKIASDTTSANWADFPTLSYNKDGVFLTANMYPISTGSAAVDVITIPKSSLLGGTTTGFTRFQNQNANNTGFSVQAAVDTSATGMPMYLLSDFTPGAGKFSLSKITGTIAAPTLAGGGGNVTVTAFGDPPDAIQPGGAPGISTNDTRFSGNVVLVNGKIWGVDSASISGRAGLKWFRIDAATGVLEESGNIADSGRDFYMGSIAVNGTGDVVVGFTASSASEYASSYAAVGLFNGATTSFASPMLLKAGTATYYQTFGGAENRWGDYSATMVDPMNSKHFWTVQEWVSSQNVWSVQFTELILAGTAVPLPPASLMGLGLLAALGGFAWKRRRSASTAT